MRILSASEAIGPAWERTKQILVVPRRFWLYIKLSLVGLLAALGSYFSFPNVSSMIRHQNGTSISHSTGMAAAIGSATLALVFFLITTALFYVGSRMQLVFVDVVATRQTTITPLWRKFSSPVWRWMGLKMVPSIFFGAALITMSLTYGARFQRAAATPVPPGTFPTELFLAFGQFFLTMLPVLAVFFLVYWFLHDFVMPVIALENAPVNLALGRATQLLKEQTGDVLLYLTVRLLLYVACVIGGYIAYLIASLVAMIPLGIIGFLLYLGVKGTVAASIVMGIGAVLAVLILGVWILIVAFFISGWIVTFFQAFALYFYGGRYALLGDLMEPAGQSWWNLQETTPPAPAEFNE